MVILCGGLATRLGDLAKNIPKSMIEIEGKPFLEHQIENLKKHSIKDIILCTGHLSEKIEEYFGKKGFFHKRDFPAGCGNGYRDFSCSNHSNKCSYDSVLILLFGVTLHFHIHLFEQASAPSHVSTSVICKSIHGSKPDFPMVSLFG